MSRHHEIPATPDNMVWGYFDAAIPPVLEIDSGDSVTLTSWMAGGKAQLHEEPSRVDRRHLAALEQVPQGPGQHFVTGPVYVRGAAPGDVLQVDILEHSFPCDWGYTCILPLLGTLPEDFDAYDIIHPDIDRARGVIVLPWGKEIRLDPFFGILAVAPRPRTGAAVRRRRRAPSAATWTIRSCGRVPRSICRCSPRALCLWPETGTACKGTARFASARSRPR
jgi:acetamidase/formamidase